MKKIPDMDQAPLHQHDSNCCTYLGLHVMEDMTVDLYWCASPTSFNLSSMLARFGDMGSHYASANPPASCADPIQYIMMNQTWYHECLIRAREAGLVPDEQWETIIPLYLTAQVAGKKLSDRWVRALPTDRSIATYCISVINKIDPAYAEPYYVDGFGETDAIDNLRRRHRETGDAAEILGYIVIPFYEVYHGMRKAARRCYTSSVGKQ